MRRLRLLPFLLPLSLAACVTHDPGWRGGNAEPFDGAKAACEDEIAVLPAAEREAAFEACMEKRGWVR